MTEAEKFIDLQRRNEDKLRDFLAFFEMALCKRCWAHTHGDTSRPYHTHGGLLEMLGGVRTDQASVDRWRDELEHGFLHCFMVLYFAYCLHPRKDLAWDSVFQFNMRRPFPSRLQNADRLVLSCLLHDFMRVNGGSENHDRKLMELSDQFIRVSYRHSNPLPTDRHNPLVGGDRLELMRYADFGDWGRPDVLSSYVESYGGRELIDHFFRHIRPAIHALFRGRNDVWISHVLEINMYPAEAMSDNRGTSTFPKSHWRAMDRGYEVNRDQDTDKFISVNVGKLPCAGCLAHTDTKWSARGLMSVPDVRRHGNEIRCAPPTTAGRDHPFLYESSPMPTKDWVFVFDDLKQVAQFELPDLKCLSCSIFNDIFRLTEDFLCKFHALSVK